jgi:sporulation protein YlmC with PRC-barrel domain
LFNTVATTALVLLAVLAQPSLAQTPEDSAAPPPPLPEAEAAQAAIASARAAPAVITGKSLTGKQVLDQAGAEVGKISELAFVEDGSVIVLLRRADAADMGIPLDQLDALLEDEPSAGRRSVLQFTARPARDRLDTAPTVARVEEVDRAWVTEVRRHFDGNQAAKGDEHASRGHAVGHGEGLHEGSSPPANGLEGPGSPPGAGQDAQDAQAAQDAPARQDTQREQVQCLGTVIGYNVENAMGEDIGSLSGVAINLPEKSVAYAIITVTHGIFGFDERQHGVSWDALRIDAKKKTAMISLERSVLDDMPGIDMKALPSRPDLHVPAPKPVSFGER